MRARPRQVVAGVADHGGWAVVVCAAIVDGEIDVVDRRRIALLDDGLPTQPYHHDTRGMAPAAAERLVRRIRQSVAARTGQALDELIAALAPHHVVSAIAMREPTLPGLPATIREAHASYHVMCRADGMLYHSAICSAARQRGWSVATCGRGDELSEAAQRLHSTVSAIDRRIREIGRTLGPPWTADHRWALAAAIAATAR